MGVRIAAWTAAVAALASGCGSRGHDMAGPMGASGVDHFSTAATFMSVSPPGDAVGVATSTAIVLRFGAGMGPGMEQFTDLHRGGLDGPTVPMSCTWSGDRTALTCTPDERLERLTRYWIHLGGGMLTSAGDHVDFGPHGPTYGGQWVFGPMMGGSHAGHAWGSMAAGWRGDDGRYGMAFSFTTTG